MTILQNSSADTAADDTGEIPVLRAERDRLAEENTTLKGQLAFKERTTHTFISGRVIGASPDPGRNMLLVDRGRADGVLAGSAVVAGDGIYVGKVQAVQENSSTILLPNDNRSKVIAAFLSDAAKTRGIVEGQFQLGLQLSFVPTNVTILKDTVVVTSGRERGIPPGLVIGSVAEGRTQSTDLFQSAALTPPLDYDTVSLVAIVKPLPQ